MLIALISDSFECSYNWQARL